MKSNVMPSIVQIEANQLKQLVTEVPETVATGIIKVNGFNKQRATFGLVDLWNIQRKSKTASIARRRSL